MLPRKRAVRRLHSVERFWVTVSRGHVRRTKTLLKFKKK
jgi:hypothetical protein